jgi:hypothetical protein
MEVRKMRMLNDELGVGGYGPFACPKGALIVSTEEVKKIRNKFNDKK